MKRLVISKYTDSVFNDGDSLLNLDLVIPEGVNALYFDDQIFGWIENSDMTIQSITTLPEWANACVDKFNSEKERLKKEHEAFEAQLLAEIQNET